MGFCGWLEPIDRLTLPLCKDEHAEMRLFPPKVVTIEITISSQP